MSESAIDEVTDAVKGRLMGGLLGNYTVAFLVLNWRVVLGLMSSLDLNAKIDWISGYLNSGVWFVYGRPVLLAAGLILAQIAGSLVTERIQIMLDNWKYQMRLRNDATANKFVNDLRIAMFFHYSRFRSLAEGVDNKQFDDDKKRTHLLDSLRNSLIETAQNMVKHLRPEASQNVPKFATQIKPEVKNFINSHSQDRLEVFLSI